MRTALAILAALALCACGANHAAEPVIQTQIVDVPTPVSCVPKDFPPPPAYPDERSVLIGADGSTVFGKIAAGWALKNARLALLEGVVADCRAAGPAPAR